jgi:hypothetical protein
MGKKYLYLFEAIEVFNADILSTAREDDGNESIQTRFIQARAGLKHSKKFMKLVLPLMGWLASWTQVLGSGHTSTIGFVRHFCKLLNGYINSLALYSAKLRSEGKMLLADTNDEFQRIAKGLFETYFGSNYSEFWIFLFAEYFDSRTFKMVASAQKKEIFSVMKKSFTDPEENLSPYDYFRKYRRDIPGTVVEEIGLDFLEEEKIQESVRRKTSALQDEMKEYEGFMTAYSGDPVNTMVDPLVFWSKYAAKFRILARVARSVLSVPPSQSDVERLFSRSGRIASNSRSQMSDPHVNELTTLAYWLDESEERLHRLNDEFSPTADQEKVIKRYKAFLSNSMNPETAYKELEADLEDEEDWADDDSDSDYEDFPEEDDED